MSWNSTPEEADWNWEKTSSVIGWSHWNKLPELVVMAETTGMKYYEHVQKPIRSVQRMRH